MDRNIVPLQYISDMGSMLKMLYVMNMLYGQPPKIIWLKIGNQPKASTIKVLQDNIAAIKQVLLADDQACIELI